MRLSIAFGEAPVLAGNVRIADAIHYKTVTKDACTAMM